MQFFSNLDNPTMGDPTPLTGSGRTGSLPPLLNGGILGTQWLQLSQSFVQVPDITGSMSGRSDETTETTQATNWSVNPGHRPGTHGNYWPGID